MQNSIIEDEKKGKLENYLSQIDDLPTLPYVVIQLMTKIHQPDPHVTELADLIMTDQILTTRLMRIVNSAYWGLNREITSVKETIVYLGLRQIQNLVYSATLANTFERDAPFLKRVLFWEHSFGCALYSRLIAKRISYPDMELAYLGGLLHDIGEVIIALHFYQKFEKIVDIVRNKGKNFYDAEEEVLGINHTDFGNWMVKQWMLPEKLSEVIGNHHNIEKAENDKTLVAIVRLADLICLHNNLDFGFTEGEQVISEIKSVWNFLASFCKNINSIDPKLFLKDCNSQIESVKKTVEAIYKIDDTE